MKDILLLITGTIVIIAKEFAGVVRDTDLMQRLCPDKEQIKVKQ